MKSSILLSLMVAACSSDDGNTGASLGGAYFGDLAIDHEVPALSIFAAADFVVDEDGSLAGSMATSTSPTSTIGDVAVVSGTITPTSLGMADAEIELVFATLGTFRAQGNLTVTLDGEQLAGRLTTRDGGGAVIGATILALQH